MISEESNIEYSQTVNWIRCKLSAKSLNHVRGARSSRYHAVSEASQGPIDLQLKVKLLLSSLSMAIYWQFNSFILYTHFSPLCVYSVLKKSYSFNYTAEIKIKTTKQEKQLLPHVVLWSRLDKACKEQEKQ